MHSQKLNEKPAHAWVIAAEDGNIDAAHCTCIAGLGEACSHVGAILFYVADKALNTELKSVTDEPAYWTPPAGIKKAKMEKVSKIDFTHPVTKMKKICTGDRIKKNVPKQRNVLELTEEQLSSFLKKISEIDPGSNNPPAVLTILAPFNNKYVVDANKMYSSDLRSIFKNENLKLSLKELQQKSEAIVFQLTDDQCENIKKDTVQQANSKLWYKYRAGRITASVIKRCCKTNLKKPSMSLIKQIVYPEKMKFVSKATAWGCSHEKVAKETYVKMRSKQHTNFQVRDSGLILNSCYPHLGASPDGIVYCDCHGYGCLEVKCPYCLRDASPEEVVEGASFLKKDTKAELDKNHSYYYQVQTQIFLGEFKYCDFVAYTQKCLFIQRIFGDKSFWEEILETATNFFKIVILPELLGKGWTRSSSSQPENQPLPSTSTCKNDKNPIIVHL